MKAVIQKREGKKIVVKELEIDETKHPEFDLYELVARRLGWCEDCDALWYLSTKNIIRIQRS